MTHWIIREWMNAITLAVFLCLAWRFGWVMMDELATFRRRQAGTAIFVLSLGECVRSAWAWLALAAQNKGWASVLEAVQEFYVAGIVATSIILIGGVCCLRVSSGSYKSSALAIMLAATFLTITILI